MRTFDSPPQTARHTMGHFGMTSFEVTDPKLEPRQRVYLVLAQLAPMKPERIAEKTRLSIKHVHDILRYEPFQKVARGYQIREGQ